VTIARDTIAAIATAPGSGGVAIVRLSGSESLAIAARIFRRRGGHGIPRSRHVYVGHVLDHASGAILDEVVTFSMIAPRSYTGEDVVEIQCHGGSVTSQRILESACAAGARPAGPGEFTKRAFLNGRMDLAQAEAVADLIMARSDAGRRLAWSQLEGALSSRVEALREAVLRARAICEVSLDFSEEDLPELENGSPVVAGELARVRIELERLTESFERGRLRYHGARVALVGRPNVGKSSLLNVLAGGDRALVTPIAGTTRDVVEAHVAISGAPVVVMDTAGIRETEDEIEAMGVERSRRAIDDAACVIAVFDRSAPLRAEDSMVAAIVRQRPCIAVLSKVDLSAVAAVAEVRAMLPSVQIVEVSALTGDGVQELSNTIGELLFEANRDARDDEVVIFRVRHRDAARKAIADLSRAEAAMAAGEPLELAASDLAAAASALADITGAMTSEDVLDRVFADFCIGK
jgi:tRNA modification GTPase